MARKYNKNKPFPYRIKIFDSATYEQELVRRKESKMRMVVEAIGWKQKALDRTRMRFTYQISKMRQQIKRRWYCYYYVFDYGAPGRLEFLCSQTSMRAKRIDESDAFFYRTYYAKCANASQLILDWLKQLDPFEYTFELHQYLLRFFVVSFPPQRWIKRYEQGRTGEHCGGFSQQEEE